jgi:hypothetical protein
MGVRENKVERYLDTEVKKIGGITRKWVSPGRDGVMDQICFLNPEWFVEVKTTDGVQEPHQYREALRLINTGARVAIVYGNNGVDKFIEWVKVRRHDQPQVQVVFK